METLAEAFPALSVEVESALAEIDQAALGRRFSTAPVCAVNFERGVGYVYLSADEASPDRMIHLQNTTSDIVLDIGLNDSPIGVEILAPRVALKSELRGGAAR
ncbi:MAG: hypothetical protein MI924_29950 [Chloroflexales bacterium]|nr:hypothetical protein [Chloroflexales bacterium]